MKIAAVIIGQHEEVLIGRMLESVKGLDMIYFTYTGDPTQPDGTLDIVRKYTDKISYFRWNDRFCDARNAAKQAAVEADWILSIDCDEILQDPAQVREAVARAEMQHAVAVDCDLIAEDNGQHFKYPRLFKNVPEVYWEGAVHNTLSVMGDPAVTTEPRITVGYSPAHNTDPDRAFRILKKEVETRFHPRSIFYLGREYWYRRDYENCVITMGKYVQVSQFLAEKADAFLIMARAYWAMSMPNDARDACVQALICNANFKEACLFMATLAGEGSGNPRWEENARQWKEMAKTATNDDVLFIRGDQ